MTAEEVKEICTLYNNGVKIMAISLAYHRSPNTINTVLRYNGIPKRRSYGGKRSEYHIEEIGNG